MLGFEGAGSALVDGEARRVVLLVFPGRGCLGHRVLSLFEGPLGIFPSPHPFLFLGI